VLIPALKHSHQMHISRKQNHHYDRVCEKQLRHHCQPSSDACPLCVESAIPRVQSYAEMRGHHCNLALFARFCATGTGTSAGEAKAALRAKVPGANKIKAKSHSRRKGKGKGEGKGKRKHSGLILQSSIMCQARMSQLYAQHRGEAMRSLDVHPHRCVKLMKEVMQGGLDCATKDIRSFCALILAPHATKGAPDVKRRVLPLTPAPSPVFHLGAPAKSTAREGGGGGGDGGDGGSGRR
jgi:hypothetical protein